MFKNWGMSMWVGLISAFVVSGLAQQLWDLEWNRALVLGVIVFILGVVISQVFRRMIRVDQD